MGITRFMVVRPANHLSRHISSSSSSSAKTVVRCGSKEGRLDGVTRGGGDEDNGKRKFPFPAAVMASEAAQRENSLAKSVTDTVSKVVQTGEERLAQFDVEMLIERGILDCRFFTLLAVAGSLLSSVLCFLEGCFFIAQSYFHYFHAISQRLDQGHVVQLLVEALDMFLVGIAMYSFGVGLHVMFVGSNKLRQNSTGSNLFGLFHMKGFPMWVEMESVSRAKSRIGQAVMMILQVGLVDKFTNTSLVTSLDLACFAAALLFTSASMFLLSRLSSL